MWARSGLLQVSPEGIDAAVRSIHEDVIPHYRDLAGYCGFSVLVDREAGEILGITYWETEEDMRSSEQAADAARRIASDAGGHYQTGISRNWKVEGQDAL